MLMYLVHLLATEAAGDVQRRWSECWGKPGRWPANRKPVIWPPPGTFSYTACSTSESIGWRERRKDWEREMERLWKMGDRRSREKRREMWQIKEKRDGAEKESREQESQTREKIKRKSREEIREKKGWLTETSEEESKKANGGGERRQRKSQLVCLRGSDDISPWRVVVCCLRAEL